MERKDTPFTAEHFVEFIKKMCELKSPYWYATCIFKCTTSRYNSKKRQCPEHYTSDRTARYQQDINAKRISADCIGAYKGYCWTNGGEGVIEAYGTDATFVNKSGSHGCPDKSANGMFEYAKSKGAEWGDIKTMPEVPGIALRFDGHVGYYIGGGYAIEWRGFAYGCVKTKVSGRKWTHWYKLPCIDYGAGSLVENGSKVYKLGERTIGKGTKGEDVKLLQTYLQALGYDLGSYGVDGDCGSFTMAAVAGFQQEHNLAADGVANADTIAALIDAVAPLGISEAKEQETAAEHTETEAQPAETVADPENTVTVNAGAWNVRSGPSTAFDSIGIVHGNDKLKIYDGDFLPVIYNGSIAWISKKAIK